MKKLATFTAVLVAGVLAAQSALALCTTIQDGTLYNTAEPPELIEPGFDTWGYNYQARIFNGGYCDSYRNAPWCQAYVDVDLLMKWNDAWLSNKDCDVDGPDVGLLDRHFGYETYIGSDAWLTNHQSGLVEDSKGRLRKWTYFVKIIAAPAGGYAEGGIWYTAGGAEIGPVIWGQFAIVEEVLNDPSNGDHGILYLSPHGPGVGSGHI